MGSVFVARNWHRDRDRHCRAGSGNGDPEQPYLLAYDLPPGTREKYSDPEAFSVLSVDKEAAISTVAYTYFHERTGPSIDNVRVWRRVRYFGSSTYTHFHVITENMTKKRDNIVERIVFTPATPKQCRNLIDYGISPGDVYDGIISYKDGTVLVYLPSETKCMYRKAFYTGTTVRALDGAVPTCVWETASEADWYRFYDFAVPDSKKLYPRANGAQSGGTIQGLLQAPPSICSNAWWKVGAVSRHNGFGVLRKTSAFLNAQANLYPGHDEIFVTEINAAEGTCEVACVFDVLTKIRGVTADLKSQANKFDNGFTPESSVTTTTVSLFSPNGRQVLSKIVDRVTPEPNSTSPFFFESKSIKSSDFLNEVLAPDSRFELAFAQLEKSLLPMTLKHSTVRYAVMFQKEQPSSTIAFSKNFRSCFLRAQAVRCAKSMVEEYNDEASTFLDTPMDERTLKTEGPAAMSEVFHRATRPELVPYRAFIAEAIVRLCAFSGVRPNFTEIEQQLGAANVDCIAYIEAYLPPDLGPYEALCHTLGEKPRADDVYRFLNDEIAENKENRDLNNRAHFGDVFRRHFFPAMLDAYSDPVRVHSAVAHARRVWTETRAVFVDAANTHPPNSHRVFAPFMRFAYARRALMRHLANRDEALANDDEVDKLIESLALQCPEYIFGCQLHLGWPQERGSEACPRHSTHDNVLRHMHRVLPRFAFPIVHQLALQPREHPDGMFYAMQAMAFMCIFGHDRYHRSVFKRDIQKYGCFMDTVDHLAELYDAVQTSNNNGKFELAEGYGPRTLTFDYQTSVENPCDPQKQKENRRRAEAIEEKRRVRLSLFSRAEAVTDAVRNIYADGDHPYKYLVERYLVNEREIAGHVFVIDGYEWSVPYNCDEAREAQQIHKIGMCVLQVGDEPEHRRYPVQTLTVNDTVIGDPAVTVEGKSLVVSGLHRLSGVDNAATVAAQLNADIMRLYRLKVAGQLARCMHNYGNERSNKDDKIVSLRFVGTGYRAGCKFDETDLSAATFGVFNGNEFYRANIDVRGSYGYIEASVNKKTVQLALPPASTFRKVGITADELALLLRANNYKKNVELVGVTHSDGRAWAPPTIVTKTGNKLSLKRADETSITIIPSIHLPGSVQAALRL